MLEFRKVTLEDREWIHEMLYHAGRKGCEYSFANLFFWLNRNGGVARVGDHLCFQTCYGGFCSFFYPAGQGDVQPVIELLRQDARERGVPFVLRGVTREDREELERLYPGKFTFTLLRDSYDYTYPVEKLANLAGKKLQAKRNHINRFIAEHPDWFTEPLTETNTKKCEEMAHRWYEEHNDAKSLDTEKAALFTALSNRERMGMVGLVLYDGENVVGFSMGNRITEKVFDVNFEKAFAAIPGAYALVNREFSRMIAAKFPEVELLNREDDMGLDGLRKAKESYSPDLLEKMIAKWEA